MRVINSGVVLYGQTQIYPDKVKEVKQNSFVRTDTYHKDAPESHRAVEAQNSMVLNARQAKTSRHSAEVAQKYSEELRKQMTYYPSIMYSVSTVMDAKGKIMAVIPEEIATHSEVLKAIEESKNGKVIDLLG